MVLKHNPLTYDHMGNGIRISLYLALKTTAIAPNQAVLSRCNALKPNKQTVTGSQEKSPQRANIT